MNPAPKPLSEGDPLSVVAIAVLREAAEQGSLDVGDSGREFIPTVLALLEFYTSHRAPEPVVGRVRAADMPRNTLRDELLYVKRIGPITEQRLVELFDRAEKAEADLAESALRVADLEGLLGACLTCDGNIDNPELEARIRAAITQTEPEKK